MAPARHTWMPPDRILNVNIVGFSKEKINTSILVHNYVVIPLLAKTPPRHIAS